MRWWQRLLNRERLERELDAELRFHIDEETDRLRGDGVQPEEARRRALASFGGLEPIKEAARDARGTRWLEDAATDLRYAFRSMRRHPGFAVTAVLSLAIGVGANTAVFTVADALLFRRVPVPRPAELAYVMRTRPAEDGRLSVTRFSHPALLRFQTALGGGHTEVAGMTPPARMQVVAAPGEDAELALAELVTGNWFSLLEVGAQSGRVFTPADDGTTAQAVAVLSDRYWTRRFARRSSVIGSTLRVNRFAVTVVGIARPGFDGFMVGSPVDLWMPTGLQQQVRYAFNADGDDADMSKPWRSQDGISWLTVIARLHPPGTRARAAAVVETVFRRDLQTAAAKYTDPRRREYALAEHVQLADGSRGISELRDEFGRAVLVLMVTVGLVLLVACANLANLLMARSSARSREFALRLSLGARRGRLIRQLLTESVLLAVIAGAASLLLARIASEGLLQLAASGPTPLPLDVSTDAVVLGFAIALSILTGVLFGLAPALRFSRVDLQTSIKATPSPSMAAGGSRIGRVLVIAQMAVSLALLVVAALSVRTLHNLLSLDPGFEASHLVTAKFDPRMAGYTAATLPSVRDRLVTAAREMPGAESAAVAMCGTMANCMSVSNIDLPGGATPVGDEANVQEDYVSGAYFAALGMPIVAGRNFADSDTPRSPLVAIVNQAMARHFFGDVSPVGKRFKEGDDYEIIGVVADSRINGLREAPPRMVFYPYSQHPEVPFRSLYVRVAGNVAPALAGVRGAIRSVDRGIAVREVVTLGELERRSVARERLVSTLTGLFGALALAVACLGLYGMVSYSVARRTNEIGIRLALGATLANVRWLVLRETVGIVVLGLLIGVAITWPALRLLEALVYGVSARDPITLAIAAATLASVAIAAGAVPAWRASRLNALVALRAET